MPMSAASMGADCNCSSYHGFDKVVSHGLTVMPRVCSRIFHRAFSLRVSLSKASDDRIIVLARMKHGQVYGKPLRQEA